MASVPAKQTSAAPATETVAERFRRLAATWQEAVAHHSSSRMRYNHPAYHEIISLGSAVVPLLLQDLEATGRHWFIALQTITGADPIPDADAGKIAKMKEAWLRWGRENGFQW